jgi:ABC-2 type transport system ATP-binding protein
MPPEPDPVASGAKPAIEASGLTKKFGDFTAVSGVSFRVDRGSIFGFVGGNGSGKSTTIRMLCGLLEPTAGSARVAGFEVPGEERRVLHRIGYMSQKLSLYPTLSVSENIRFAAGIYGLDDATREARWRVLSARLGLGPHARTRVSDLSGGIKQRTALCCSILHEPEIVFLDEPTAGVDLENRGVFWELIREMARAGVTVFVTSHYMEEMEFADRIGFIDRGELIALDSPARLKARHAGGYPVEIAGPPGAPPPAGQIIVLPDFEPATVAEAERRVRARDPGLHLRMALPPLDAVFMGMLRARERAREEGAEAAAAAPARATS